MLTLFMNLSVLCLSMLLSMLVFGLLMVRVIVLTKSLDTICLQDTWEIKSIINRHSKSIDEINSKLDYMLKYQGLHQGWQAERNKELGI